MRSMKRAVGLSTRMLVLAAGTVATKTVAGTLGRDTLHDTSQADSIYGYGGVDLVRGDGSADSLYSSNEAGWGNKVIGMRKTVLLLASMAIAVLLASGAALAAAGELDPSFDGDGKVILEQNGGAEDVAVHPDGGLVVAGASSDGIVVVRLKSDGNLDSSFGGGDGVVTTNIQAFGGYGGRPAAVVRPDGKIVVAGTDGYGVALVRYNVDGTLDKGFGGGDGRVITDPPGRSEVYALLRQSDGKLVVAGRNVSRLAQSQDFLLVRYHADGSRDLNFGGDGIVTTSVGSSVAVARDLVSRPDGKLVVAGDAYRSGHHVDFALVRYNPNGTVDGSFGGGDGKAYADFGYKEFANALVRYDGGVVVAGYKQGPPQGADTLQQFALARFTSDGRLDQRFSGDGSVVTDIIPGGHSYASDLIVQDDGKLVAAGHGDEGDFANPDFALARYHSDGRLDDSFGGGDGYVLTDFGANSSVGGLTVQPNEKIVAAGIAGGKFALARYLAE